MSTSSSPARQVRQQWLRCHPAVMPLPLPLPLLSLLPFTSFDDSFWRLGATSIRRPTGCTPWQTPSTIHAAKGGRFLAYIQEVRCDPLPQCSQASLPPAIPQTHQARQELHRPHSHPQKQRRNLRNTTRPLLYPRKRAERALGQGGHDLHLYSAH